MTEIIRGMCLIVAGLIVTLTPAVHSADVTEVVGDVGSKITLECKSFNLVERCKFTKPNGRLLCNGIDGDEELTEIDDCEEDPFVSLKVSQETCRLTISKLNQNHLGPWTCVTYDWSDEPSEIKINVREASGPKKIVEIYHIEDFDVINIAKTPRKSYQCGVFSPSKSQPLSENPGPMVWKVGNKVVSTSDVYTKDQKGNFVQEFKYAPKLTDNDSKVSCSLKSGESSDEFDLTVLTLESLSNNDPVEIVDADKVITRRFKAIPPPEKFQVYWEISASTGTTKVFQGKTSGDFKADLVKTLPNNEFEASIILKTPLNLKSTNPSLKLSVQVGPKKRTDFLLIPVILTFADGSNPSNEEKKETENRKDDVEQISQGAADEEDSNNDVEKSEAKSSNTSIFIIIIIIMLVIIVCAVYYCCKCRFNLSGQPEPRSQPTRNLKDVEEGKPLVSSSIDQPDNAKHGDANAGLLLAEKDLLAKLEPSPDESQESVAKPESQTKREAFAAAGGKVNLENENDSFVHEEIAKMADIIQSFEEDDLLQKERFGYEEQLQTAVPIPEDERDRTRTYAKDSENFQDSSSVKTGENSTPKTISIHEEADFKENGLSVTSSSSPVENYSDLPNEAKETEPSKSPSNQNSSVVSGAKPPRLSIKTKGEDQTVEKSPEGSSSSPSVKSVSTQTPNVQRSSKNFNAFADVEETICNSDEDTQAQHW